MHLNAFAGLSCAFILPFFDLTCYTSVYRMIALITFLYKQERITLTKIRVLQFVTRAYPF